MIGSGSGIVAGVALFVLVTSAFSQVVLDPKPAVKVERAEGGTSGPPSANLRAPSRA